MAFAGPGARLVGYIVDILIMIAAIVVAVIVFGLLAVVVPVLGVLGIVLAVICPARLLPVLLGEDRPDARARR